MKIELEIDPGELGKSIGDILNVLSPEEKKALATSAMQSWLREPKDIERITKDRWAIDQVRAEERNYGAREQKDEEIRRHYRYEALMNGWRSSRETMIDGITKEVIEFYKAEVKRTVEADPRILAMKDEVVKILLETFPKIVHDAMTVYVASSFQKVLDQTHGLDVRVEQMGVRTQELGQRLLQVAQAVGH